MKPVLMKTLTTKNIQKYTLGTWGFSGEKNRDNKNNDVEDIKTIQMHIDHGVNQIFTGQNYAEGWTERLVGEAVKPYKREELILSTAIRKENSSYDNILRSTEESLKRMNLDYIYIVVHHAPYPGVSISESIRGLNTLLDRGLTRGIAVSNYNSDSLGQAINSTNHPILFNQVYYNLTMREVEEDGLLGLTNANNILIQAFRPLEMGEFEDMDINIFEEMALKYSFTKTQLALSWLTSQENVVVVATTHKEDHLVQNLETSKIRIEEHDVEYLRKNFPRKTPKKVWIR
jgi:diketogulonate reductase-like aldo/keto reductase